MFRARAATITPDGIDYEAEADVTFKDFRDAMGTLTYGQFSALWENRTYRDFAIQPLRTE